MCLNIRIFLIIISVLNEYFKISIVIYLWFYKKSSWHFQIQAFSLFLIKKIVIKIKVFTKQPLNC